MKKILLLTLLFLNNNILADWHPFSTYTPTISGNESSVYVYINKAESERKKGYNYIWILKNISNKTSGVSSYIEYHQIDCDGPLRSKELKVTAYSEHWGKGNTMGTKSVSGKWSYPTPGSIGREIAETGCGQLDLENKFLLSMPIDMIIDLTSNDVSEEDLFYVSTRCAAVFSMNADNSSKTIKGYEQKKTFFFNTIEKLEPYIQESFKDSNYSFKAIIAASGIYNADRSIYIKDLALCEVLGE